MERKIVSLIFILYYEQSARISTNVVVVICQILIKRPNSETFKEALSRDEVVCRNSQHVILGARNLLWYHLQQ